MKKNHTVTWTFGNVVGQHWTVDCSCGQRLGVVFSDRSAHALGNAHLAAA